MYVDHVVSRTHCGEQLHMHHAALQSDITYHCAFPAHAQSNGREKLL